ncbi:glycosyltransferase family 2 protein [Pedobacter heparinus]|uniref:glycosyltransferase family 2 protein n=1 Tax=Pedobacter heparinus TaxID=984 RepID=UPI00292DCE4B|nr:glycosyltransferase family 2 protein [Pedobacter heparinus]
MISIIIINYNTFQLTVNCIASIVDNTSCNYEIIVVDNASTECDPEEFKIRFPFIKLIKNPGNYGFAKGNNTGLNLASGDYILLLNSDTLLINNAIDLTYEKILSDKKIGALSAQLVSVDGTFQQCSHYWTSLRKILGCTFRLHHMFKSLKPIQPDLKTEHYSEYLWGTFFLFPKEILKIFKDKKLPETFFMYAEDTEWCHYIKKAGYKLLYYPTAKITHYGGASSNNNTKKWTNGFHNEYRLSKMVNGQLYTFFYYQAIVLFYFSGIKKETFEKGIYILRHMCKDMIKSA